MKRAIRYLGVQLYTRLSFIEHACTIVSGAKRAAVALGRLISNVGESYQAKHSLLMSEVHSYLLYGAPVWDVWLI